MTRIIDVVYRCCINIFILVTVKVKLVCLPTRLLKCRREEMKIREL